MRRRARVTGKDAAGFRRFQGACLLCATVEAERDAGYRMVAEQGDVVVVAPNPDLPDPVVLTAWLTKQTCSGVDLATVETFIQDQQGRGPGADF